MRIRVSFQLCSFLIRFFRFKIVIEIVKTPVTTEGDNLILAEGVVTLEVARHGRFEYRWVPRSWTYFVHAWGVMSEGVEVVLPEHDDEAVMVGAPVIGQPLN